MADRLIIGQVAGGLGDWISLTPTLRSARDAGLNPLVLAPDSVHTREFATLYQGLAEVEFLPAGHERLSPTKETSDPTCFSLRIMRAYGLTGSPIPYVEVTDDEMTIAGSLLMKRAGMGCLEDVMWGLVAVAPSPGGARADLPDSHICNYRRWPTELRDRLIERLHSQGLQPVRFGTKQRQAHIYANHEEIEGVLTIPDLSLRQVAACYSVIGRYCGTDTGDHHLMLAVGGESDLWIPPSSWFYDHTKHLYGADAWAGWPRERYHVYPRDLPTILS